MQANKRVRGIDFPQEEIAKARMEGKLLSLDIELSKICNLKCIYCYAE